MAQELRKLATTLAEAKAFKKAMETLSAISIRMEADGTWVAKDKELVFARSCSVVSVGTEWIVAEVDGQTVRMKPYTAASLPTDAFIAVIGKF